MIVGRKEEILRLERAYANSQASEFVAVYGRRRIGKTYLVRQTFNDRFTFRYTGIFNVSNKEQLREFHHSLMEQGLPSSSEAPKDWFEAFRMLATLLDACGQKRKVVFLDELPWMDAPNSKFLPAFEHFWNDRASARTDILLIICGSATSWIFDNVFYNKGGLYNRVTCKIRLGQFSLNECEELARELRLPFSRRMILEGYMVMGGVPYYWANLQATKSIRQNINDLFLKSNGELHGEFRYIYASMFNKPEKYIQVVEALSGKKSGLTRDEIIRRGKIDSSGRLSKILEDLVECGFVRKYCHLDKKLKDAVYQLVDCYTLFYYQFVRYSQGNDEDYWMKVAQTPAFSTWSGLAFERVCLLHSRQIKAALGISGILANLFSWHIKKTEEHPGAQIDLLIDRSDNIINICEIKYSAGPYRLTTNEMDKIRSRASILQSCVARRKSVQPVLIVAEGPASNRYSLEIPLVVTAEQLFAP